MARNAYIATPSGLKAITTLEAKQHLRVAHSDDDTYIDSLVLSAQQTIESYCNILLFRQTVIQYADTFMDVGELYFSPVKNSGAVAVTSITYTDPDLATVTWAASNYIADIYASPVRIGMTPDGTLPTIANQLNAVKITYSVGVNSASLIPEALKQAILILVGQWYENRQVAVVGRSVGTIPMTAQYLMNPYKVQTLGMATC
tara:strand:- start:2480 stop:3085 length:606 start_codon:yes stop_codon:yes gene_type:complete